MKEKLTALFSSAAYNILIAVLAIISIVLAVLDIRNTANLQKMPFSLIDNSILFFFTLDYFCRFSLAKKKNQFFLNNIFDLLAIIPFNSLASFLRVARLVRIARLLKLIRFTRVVGLTGKFSRNVQRFLKTNGFIYFIYAGVVILFLATNLYAIVENESWNNAFWWAITTTTNGGYGDISPQTLIGKIASVSLMLVGICLVGILTSTITNFFVHTELPDKPELEKITKQNQLLLEEIKTLKTEIHALKQPRDHVEKKHKDN